MDTAVSEITTNALTYFTGKPCPKGHYSERYVSNSVCVACKRIEYKPNGRKVGNSNLPERVAAIEAGDEFYITGKPCKHGHISKRYTKDSRCYECTLSVFKTYRRGKERQYSLAKYGITPSQYDDMLWKQSGVCAICKKPETMVYAETNKAKPLSVDHCHKTKKVRGLLCSACNTGIGFLSHDPETLRRAAMYCE